MIWGGKSIYLPEKQAKNIINTAPEPPITFPCQKTDAREAL